VNDGNPTNTAVIPAKAGIHAPGGMISGHGQFLFPPWFPACAGMTRRGKDEKPSPDCPAE
jgi:hypothetical protein